MASVPRMSPEPGAHVLRFVGDRLHVRLSGPSDVDDSFRAFLRTNLTRAGVARREVVARAGLRGEEQLTFAGASWRDIPLRAVGRGEWEIDLPLLEVGYFRAKAYCIDGQGRQRWPDNGDLGIAVHPNHLRTANIVYCAFPRTFGRVAARTVHAEHEPLLQKLASQDWALIPPSGTLRALTREVPFIIEELGCRILHLLPIGPVPTTFARMGRYGSPYAQLDLTDIDLALVELDKRTTAVDQFFELTDAVHLRGGNVLLDIVLNHTGWGSRLWNTHPQWFQRNADGTFHSPGAWGVTWGDLVELDQDHPELWDVLAESLLVWCRRGVDGFRCDAGYMIPLPAWQYVVACVRNEFPDTTFLLEGLGGAWEATERLLTEGGMQWAYSELFQCYDPEAVSGYIDHANSKSETIGTLLHYSETHDNDRLAAKGPSWSLMRNRLCALSSHGGGFGFMSGVEWLCDVKFRVHEAHTLYWGQSPNLVRELADLSALLREHPCFFDGAQVERLSEADSHVLALHRTSADGTDECLVLINLDAEESRELVLSRQSWLRGGEKRFDLLGHTPPAAEWGSDDTVRLRLSGGEAFCLSAFDAPRGLHGDAYRLMRAQAAFAFTALGAVLPHEMIGSADPAELAREVSHDVAGLLGAISVVDPEEAREDLLHAIRGARAAARYARVVIWEPSHATRITLVPPEHWVLMRDERPFEVSLAERAGPLHLRSTPAGKVHVVAVPPLPHDSEHDVRVELERFADTLPAVHATLRRLAVEPTVRTPSTEGLVLLVNGRGGMTRMHANIGEVRSKYDCVLGANLHPTVPCDRHVLVKRLRAWVNADGFITALDGENLTQLEAGPPAVWAFAANAGDGRRVGIRLSVELLNGENTVRMRFERVPTASLDLPSDRDVRLILRFDIEDRNFHAETEWNEASDEHFRTHAHTLASELGFSFRPAPDRQLWVRADRGSYHPEAEWCRAVPHPVEATRGMQDRGDAFSPGWFEVPLAEREIATFVLSAEPGAEGRALASLPPPRMPVQPRSFEALLREAARAYIVKRGEGLSVIAGYPWFLDWGRDTLIAARGLAAAGLHEKVSRILMTYARFEDQGTLPNLMSGEATVSRETSDAPLWFGLACEETARHVGASLYDQRPHPHRSLLEVLASIASSLIAGAPNGVCVDHETGLVFSPPHYTWMDTNYPAATPREGYPIELSVLFIRLLTQLSRFGVRLHGEPAEDWAERARASMTLFYRPELGYCADTLHAPRGVSARRARPDDHLRPNQLLAVSLGIFEGEQARSIVRAAGRCLLVPGALRTLAPLPVAHALPVRDAEGRLLNDPQNPYKGRYEGDEDSQRKPAYHNGTAWVWWLPTYCEALVHAYEDDESAVLAARAILGSTARLMEEGCIGQLPEIIDGDAPHAQRGCDAQAWSVTETLRVWLALSGK